MTREEIRNWLAIRYAECNSAVENHLNNPPRPDASELDMDEWDTQLSKLLQRRKFVNDELENLE